MRRRALTIAVPVAIFIVVFGFSAVALPLGRAEQWLQLRVGSSWTEILANTLFRWGAAPSAIILYLIARLHHRIPKEGLNLSITVGPWSLGKQSVVGLIAGIVCAIPAFIGMLLFSEHRLTWSFEPYAFIGNVFSDFYKEFMYRGYLLGAITYRSQDPVAAIILSSSLCAVGHIFATTPETIAIFFITALWAILTIRSRSLLPAYIAHLIMDLTLMQLRGIQI